VIKFLNILCFKISDGISILVEMQNKSMSVRGWVRMMKDEPEVLEPFSIRGCFVVVVFVCDDALFLMRPLCFTLSFLIRLPADPNVRTEPQSDIGRNRGKKKEPFSIRAVRAEVFNELQEMLAGALARRGSPLQRNTMHSCRIQLTLMSSKNT